MYSAFSCPECETMEGVRDFCLDQPRDEIENLKCMHSKAAEYLTGSTENYWDIPHPSNDIFVQSLIDQGGNLFLGTYQTQGLISVLGAGILRWVLACRTIERKKRKSNFFLTLFPSQAAIAH